MKNLFKIFTFVIALSLIFGMNLSAQDQPSSGPIPMDISTDISTDIKIQPPAIMNFDITAVNAYGYRGFPATGKNFIKFPIPGYTITAIGSSITYAQFASSGVFAPSNRIFYLITIGSATIPSKIYKINKTTGASTFYKDVSGTVKYGFNGITHDRTTGTYYVCTGTKLYKLNITTGAATLVGAFGHGGTFMIDITVDCNGIMYGVDLGKDKSYKINKSTGAATELGALGYNLNYGAGMSCDRSTGKIYILGIKTSPNTNQLRELNTTTGGTTLIHSFSPLSQIAPFDIDASCVPPLSKPGVLYYTFDETERDSTKNYAVPGSGAPWAKLVGTNQTIAGVGQWGNALNGTGTSSSTDYVNTGWTTDIGTSSWTISLWLKNMTTTFGYLFGDNTANSWRCFLNGSAGTNNIMLRGGGMKNLVVKGVVPGPSVVTFVYDSAAAQIRGYLNGVRDTVLSQTALDINGTSPFKVGGYSSSSGLKGMLDEFRLYNKALTDAEVAAAWNHRFIISGIKPVLNIVPEEYNLSQNYPNPFNPTTKINYTIPKTGLVTLKVYDILGKEIATLVNEVKNTGSYIVEFNGSNLPSGTYFYRLEAGDYVNVKKMLFIK